MYHIIFVLISIMKTQNRHKWILILMVMSQILLVCFALYWLNSQYKLEKDALLKDMYSYYKQSYNVTVDSMLVKNIIKPAMNDSINHYYNYGFHSGAIVMADSFKIVKGSMPFRKRNKDGKGIVTIRLDSSQDTSGVKSFHAESEGLDDDMLIRRVKLWFTLALSINIEIVFQSARMSQPLPLMRVIRHLFN